MGIISKVNMGVKFSLRKYTWKYPSHTFVSKLFKVILHHHHSVFIKIFCRKLVRSEVFFPPEQSWNHVSHVQTHHFSKFSILMKIFYGLMKTEECCSKFTDSSSREKTISETLFRMWRSRHFSKLPFFWRSSAIYSRLKGEDWPSGEVLATSSQFECNQNLTLRQAQVKLCLIRLYL